MTMTINKGHIEDLQKRLHHIQELAKRLKKERRKGGKKNATEGFTNQAKTNTIEKETDDTIGMMIEVTEEIIDDITEIILIDGVTGEKTGMLKRQDLRDIMMTLILHISRQKQRPHRHHGMKMTIIGLQENLVAGKKIQI